MASAKQIFQDKRVQLGAILALLAAAGGGAALYFSQAGGGSNNAATLEPGPPPNAGGPGAGGGAPGLVGGAPGAPGVPAGPGAMAPGANRPGLAGAAQPGAPGATARNGALVPVPPGAKGARVAVVAAPVRMIPQDSFADAPAGYGGAAAGGGGRGLGGASSFPGSPGFGSAEGGGGMSPGVAAGRQPAAVGGDKPAPIVAGHLAPSFRGDPFVSFLRSFVMKPPAYSFIAPIRMAARPTPPPPAPVRDPDLRFGPLPVVERRVAGILFDGSVSAILETGAPGAAGTDVRVIQPGATVPSGVPNLEDLTVASITPSLVVLRAQDGRTTTVKLSNVSAAFADQFRSAASGQGAGGGSGQGRPGLGGQSLGAPLGAPGGQ